MRHEDSVDTAPHAFSFSVPLSFATFARAYPHSSDGPTIARPTVHVQLHSPDDLYVIALVLQKRDSLPT